MMDIFIGGWGKGDADKTGTAIRGLFDNTIAIYEGLALPARSQWSHEFGTGSMMEKVSLKTRAVTAIELKGLLVFPRTCG